MSTSTTFAIPMPVETAPKTEQRGGVTADDQRESVRRFTEMQTAEAARALALRDEEAKSLHAQALLARQIKAISARASTVRAEAQTRLAVSFCAGAVGVLLLRAVWRAT